MLHLGVRKIPECHIMLRWTKKARDCVPTHLVPFPDAGGIAQARVFRRNVLQSTANEIVRLGDQDNQSFEILLRYLGEAKEEIAKAASLKSAELSFCQANIASTTDASSMEEFAASDKCGADFLAVVDREANTYVLVDQMKPPESSRHFGRPSNRRYHCGVDGRITRVQRSKDGALVKRGCNPKPLVKLPRYCRICRKPNHDSRTCPENPNGKYKGGKRKSVVSSDSEY